MTAEMRKPYAISLLLTLAGAIIVSVIVTAADWGRDDALLLSLPVILLASIPVLLDEIRGGKRTHR